MSGRHSYTIVTPPTDEPITVAEAKLWAKIDTDDDDVIITQLITAARNSAEQYLRRSLITQTLKLTLDLAANSAYNSLPEGTYDLPISALFGGVSRVIELPAGPIQSITSIVTYDQSNTPSTFDPSNYNCDTAGARLVLNYGAIWPSAMRHHAAMEVNYVAGYGIDAASVPQAIRTGMMIHVASMYEQRGQTADAMDMPPGTKQLYNQYRIVGNRL